MATEFFQFSKFQENEAKHDKRNFKRRFTMTFKVKNCRITEKIGLQFS